MDKVYRSKYEAYPFLADAADDLQCDFEILTDRVTSLIGLLRSMCGEAEIREELLEIGTLVYHANPTLRTRMTITQAEVEWLAARTQRLREETAGRCEKFVLPQGSPRGSLAHVLRSDGKQLVRMLYRHAHAGRRVDELLFDFVNLLSGYFFMLSMKLNALDGVDEAPFESRNY